MTSANLEAEGGLPPWVLPALLISGILFGHILLGCLEESFGQKKLGFALHHVIHLLFLFALLFLPYRAYGLYLARRYGRAVVYLLLACLGVFFAIAQSNPTDRFQIILYFPLGTALYRARSTAETNTGLRCYLDIFLVLVITVFLQELVKGVSPVARYGPGIGHDNAMGMVGAFFGRNLDFQRPYRFKKILRTRKYAGTAPLLDVHLYWRDIVYVAILGAFFLVQDSIDSFYRGNDLVGTWSFQGARDSLLSLHETGAVLCHSGEGGWIPIRRWGIEGNLLDGYFLFMVPQRRTENVACSFLNPWFEKRNRFRLQGDTLVFDKDTADWVWPFKTVFPWLFQTKDATNWERIE